MWFSFEMYNMHFRFEFNLKRKCSLLSLLCLLLIAFNKHCFFVHSNRSIFMIFVGQALIFVCRSLVNGWARQTKMRFFLFFPPKPKFYFPFCILSTLQFKINKNFELFYVWCYISFQLIAFIRFFPFHYRQCCCSNTISRRTATNISLKLLIITQFVLFF